MRSVQFSRVRETNRAILLCSVPPIVAEPPSPDWCNVHPVHVIGKSDDASAKEKDPPLRSETLVPDRCNLCKSSLRSHPKRRNCPSSLTLSYSSPIPITSPLQSSHVIGKRWSPSGQFSPSLDLRRENVFKFASVFFSRAGAKGGDTYFDFSTSTRTTFSAATKMPLSVQKLPCPSVLPKSREGRLDENHVNHVQPRVEGAHLLSPIVAASKWRLC